MRTVTLTHLDGRPWASAGFLPGGDVWGWIVETVAHEHGVPEDAVGCLETEDGDAVTVAGEPIYSLLTINIRSE
ncbi:hypothetical protein ACQR1I_36755 [Bradyrhizobium sp. HKCCYLS2038]|uniref:hypothetical protein n=1 Tax=Bradyrhizobium sp. HKCCYLS2038 TaxID=3420764 RepID=UPI003EB74293